MLGRPVSPPAPRSPTNLSVVWFGCYDNLQWRSESSGRGGNWRSRITWLSAGRDGMVCGRSLATDGAGTGDEWTLNLAAHKPAEVTDVDVDPQGRWIVTGSTDCTVRVSKTRLKIKGHCKGI